MFKIPEWGSDIPKTNVEVCKLFGKNNKNKNIKKNTNSNIKDAAGKNIKITEKNKVNINGKHKKKPRQKPGAYIKLSKQDHINNRILKNKLKNATDKVNSEDAKSANIEGKNVEQNKVDTNIKKELKNKINISSNESKKFENCIESKVTQGNVTKDNNSSGTNKKSSRKRKHIKNTEELDNIDVHNFNANETDTLVVNHKRKKLSEKIKKDDVETVLFGNNDTIEVMISNKNNQSSKNKNTVIPCNVEVGRNEKRNKKKEILKKMLDKDSNRNIISTTGNKLRMKMMERLKAAQFRYLNEKLYTSSGAESQEMFKLDPVAFQTYHEGYQQQVKKWPVNPLDLVVKRIQQMPKSHLIADMGCGEAALSKRVVNKVRSFDLVETAPGVEACNMAHTPLLAASMDVVVFCLALMGTDLTQYLLEAHRVLKIGGHLLIAEVESRFENAESFSSDVQRLGFSLKKMDKSHRMFFFMEFSKVRDAPAKKHKLPALSLKPCLYKKR